MSTPHPDRIPGTNSKSAYRRVLLDEQEDSEIGALEKTLSTPRSSSTAALVHHVRRVGSWTVPVLMLGTLAAALAVIGAHHVFLSAIDGKGIEDYALPQTWVRDLGNALSHIVQLLLETSIGVALTQSIWFYVRRSTVKLPELDGLFSLPSVFNIPNLAIRFSMIYVVLMVVSIQGLSFIAILAPNALSVVSAGPRSSALRVPLPALDMMPVNESVVPIVLDTYCDFNYETLTSEGCYSNALTYSSASSGVTAVVQKVTSNGFILPWAAPAGCGLACNYTVAYYGPSLLCEDIPPSSIGYIDLGDPDSSDSDSEPALPIMQGAKGYIQRGMMYNATTNFGSVLFNTNTDGSTQAPTFYGESPRNDQYRLTVVYAMDDFNKSRQVITKLAGASCTFMNASYNAAIGYSNGTQTIRAWVAEYIEPYNSSMARVTNVSNDAYASDPGLHAAFASFGIMDALTRFLTGFVMYTEALNPAPASTQILTSAFYTVRTESTVELSTVNLTGGTSSSSTSLALALGSTVGKSLEDLCTNVTASLMSDASNLASRQVTVSGMVLPDETIYDYQPYRLWVVYATAILVALVADIFGLACMRSNGGAMQRTFSTIVASARGGGLNDLVNSPEEPLDATAREIKLRYRGTTSDQSGRIGFVVVDDEIGDENRERSA